MLLRSKGGPIKRVVFDNGDALPDRIPILKGKLTIPVASLPPDQYEERILFHQRRILREIPKAQRSQVRALERQLRKLGLLEAA